MTCGRNHNDDPTRAKQFDTEEHRDHDQEFVTTDIVANDQGDSHSELAIGGNIKGLA